MSEVQREERIPGTVAPEVGKSRGFSVVWIVPLVALLAGAGLVWQHYQEKGPTVRIHFEAANGLTAGKTKIKYKSIEVGTVIDVELTDDLEGVVATAELDREAAPFLNEETIFWAVRPEIGTTGVTGLDALVSGVYIGVLPGHGDTPKAEFEGLPRHPLRAGHPDALALTLEAPELGSVDRGTKLYYRSLVAGEVVDYALTADGSGVEIALMVDPDFAHRIRHNTVFWSGGGIEVSVGAAGLQVHAGSLQSLISGGIRFETPADSQARAARPGDDFALHSNYADATRALERFEGLDVWLETTRAKGIAAGSPVYYHEQQIGHIGEPKLSDDATTTRFRRPRREPVRAARAKQQRLLQSERLPRARGTRRLRLRSGHADVDARGRGRCRDAESSGRSGRTRRALRTPRGAPAGMARLGTPHLGGGRIGARDPARGLAGARAAAGSGGLPRGDARGIDLCRRPDQLSPGRDRAGRRT